MKHTETLGVIGGLGPEATAHFMELVTRMTQAEKDQDHLDMIVYSIPSVPDRTAFILDKKEDNPLFPLLDIGHKLEEQGAQRLAIPCVTAHYFYRQIADEISIPVINMISETAECLYRAGIRTAGIMATAGSVKGRVFERTFDRYGIRTVCPSADGQEAMMDLIYHGIKSGNDIQISSFTKVSRALRDHGAEEIVLGCTELSLLKQHYRLGPGYLDALEVLAQQAVICCGAQIKAQYRNLVN